MESDLIPDENEFEKLINDLAMEMAKAMFNEMDRYMMSFQYKEGKLMQYILPLN